ncbi:aerobic carbon-monoxide dehydrogenase large subunit [Enterovirga sp. CN4-39]|uniref:aerobic carbon-monoxide dehydrogenase large subunit n=1 Tax=Enterovirga sp. CN4-39 TaxID=3400910 RepID=UPI003C012EC6
MGVEVFGRPVPRLEDERLLRGRGLFVDDVHIPGALHVAFLRSPLAHARIRGIGTAAAEKLPGVRAVFTHRDLGPLDRPLPMKRGEHPDVIHPVTARPMAREEAFYAGQIVAMAIAESRYLAEDALDLIEVEYEPLPVVVGLEKAAADGAPRVHPEAPGNVAGRIRQVVGDPDAAFASADLVVSARLALDRSAAMPMETRGMAARYDAASGDLTVWTNSQTLAPLRSGIAAMLGLREEKVRLIVPDTGGGFGVKGSVPYPDEVLIPWAAMRLGEPVRWTEDRIEHFIGSHHERQQVHYVDVAADRDGIVTALRDSFLMDNGAFTPYGMELGRVSASHIGGPYRLPAIDVEVAGIYSNVMMSTPYRGAGRPHACFVYERVMDRVARRLGLDRAEVRRRNFIRRDEFPYPREGLSTVDDCTVTLDSGDYHRQLDMLLEAIGYAGFPAEQEAARREGRHLGLGLACYVEATGMGPYEGARVEILALNGRLLVATGVTTQGQSHETTFAQIAAQELGVPVEDVTVVTGDTQAFRWGVGTYASRALVMSGNAIAQAARTVRAKALLLASRMLEIDESELELSDGYVRARGSRNLALSFRQLAIAARPGRWPPPGGAVDPEIAAMAALAPPWPRTAPGQSAPLAAGEEPGLEATSYFAARNAAWGSGAHAAVVEVDPRTGDLTFLRYAIVHDCGRVVNPKVVEGQILGGLAQGIGGAFYERIAYDEDGQLTNGSLMDFLVPYATEVPNPTILHLETPSPFNPLGIKGVGEAGTIPVAALLASAVEDALSPFGIEVDEMPLDPARIRKLVREAEGRRPGAP